MLRENFMDKLCHPPLAPNCPLVQEYSDGGLYLLYENRQHGCKFDFGDCADTRTIIAALEETAWRLDADIHKKAWLESKCASKEESEADKLFCRSIENARDWREWGNNDKL